MTDDVAAALAEARGIVTPEPAERAALEAVTALLRERAEAALAERDVDADVVLVGSTARETWLPGDRDVDVFIRFPTELDRAELREHGLAVGHEVLGGGREEYAEHPYVTGEVRIEGELAEDAVERLWAEHDGDDATADATEDEPVPEAIAASMADLAAVDVDVVPCYDVEEANAIRSAVDRTPFHTAYVREHLDEALATEVRLAKAFTSGIGVYGSDLRTRGFSGYLLELLVLEYGGFEALLRAAADWTPPIEFDPADHGAASFEDPLVLIDPTDPERNVAAVCSAENLARFQHHARRFLEDPTVDAFAVDRAGVGPSDDEAPPPERFDAVALREHLQRRGTTPIALRFAAPDLVEDDLYPQLRTSLSGIVDQLDRADFDVLRSTAAVAGDDAILLVELEVAERPAVERHEGPPVHVREHAENFRAAYENDDAVYGPFVDGERYVVERPRDVTRAADLLDSDALFESRHGAAIEGQLAEGFELLVGEDVLELLPAFGAVLADYFEPEP